MPTPKTDESAIRQVIKALQAAGWRLNNVHDGEDVIPARNDADTALAAIMAVDEARLDVLQRDGVGEVSLRGWVLFVLGNDPEEVACDYTVNLSDVLEPLFDRWLS